MHSPKGMDSLLSFSAIVCKGDNFRDFLFPFQNINPVQSKDERIKETRLSPSLILCLRWGFTAQSTQWGHVECGQFT